MVDDALAGLTLTELAADIGARKVSSLEATENCLAGLERHGPALNCVAGIEPEAALEAARAADAELAAGRAAAGLAIGAQPSGIALATGNLKRANLKRANLKRTGGGDAG